METVLPWFSSTRLPEEKEKKITSCQNSDTAMIFYLVSLYFFWLRASFIKQKCSGRLIYEIFFYFKKLVELRWNTKKKKYIYIMIGCQEWLSNLPSWRSSKAAWIWFWAPCSGFPCLSRGGNRWNLAVSSNLNYSVIMHEQHGKEGK